MKKIFILYGALAIIVISLIIWRAGDINFTLPFTSQANAQVNNHEIELTVVRSERDRMNGLSGRRSLDRDDGMLFVFEEKDRHSFWMKNMNFPLDIIYIDDNKVVDIKKNAQPISEEDTSPTIYTPSRPANYVLEVNAGVADEYKITVGSTISFENID